MNDIINTSEEEWVVQTPPPFETSLNMNDPINTSPKLATELVGKSPSSCGNIDVYNESEEEWILETPPNVKTFQMGDKTKPFQEKSTLKSLSVNEITLLNNDKNNKTGGRLFKNRTAVKKNNLTNTSEEEWIVESHSCCNTDKTNRACEEGHGKSYCGQQSHFEPCENIESYGNKCGRSYSHQTQFELDKINDSNKYKWVTKSYFESDENNNTDRGICKKSLNRETVHSLKDINKSNENRFINVPYRSVYKSDYEGDKKKWKPNIEAPEFIPQSTKKIQSKVNNEQFSPLKNSTYSHFSLRDLLNYDVDLMPSEELMDYANALKLRVLDKISEFEPSYKEELEILCQLNDGSLTDRNKKIISLRICTLVKRTVVNEPECNQERSQRHTRFRKLAG